MLPRYLKANVEQRAANSVLLWYQLLDFISVRDELDASQNSLRQSIQRIQSNIAWVQTYYSVIRNFFVTNA